MKDYNAYRYPRRTVVEPLGLGAWLVIGGTAGALLMLAGYVVGRLDALMPILLWIDGAAR